MDRLSDWIEAMRGRRYDNAWAMADASRRSRDPASRDDPALPYHLRWLWDGRPPDRADVLVRCYHGLGDTIQFARYLPLLAARAGSLTVETPERLVDLFRRAMPGLRFRPFDPARPLPPAEVDIEITEMDAALQVAPETVAMPYLRADPAPLPPCTVALCYGSGAWDPGRSAPPALFAPLCARAPCVTLMPEPTTLDVLNPAGCPFDMGRTAALIASADLIVTVDTMIAHLAGALGRPAWLLVKADPDWRWTPGARDSAWYPTMRLYHQATPGDWAPVLTEVERDLAVRMARAAA